MSKWRWIGAAKRRRHMRRVVFDRDGYRCKSCGWEPGDRRAQVGIDPENPPARFLTLDHILPRALGGRSVLANLQTLCNRCNGAKADTFEWDDTAEDAA